MSCNFGARIYGPQRVAAVVATLAETGVSPTQALAGSDLDEEALQSSTTRVSYEQVATVFRNAVRLGTHPATALRAGARMHITSYGMYGYGLLSSPTRGDLIDFILKYNRVMGPVAGPVAYQRDPTVGHYTFEVLLSSDPTDELYRFALEFAFAAHLRLGRDLLGPDFILGGLRARYREPAHVAIYRELFDGEILFDQAENSLQVAAPWIDHSPGLPDPITHAMVAETCQQVLDELPSWSGVASEVRKALIEHMPWRFPTIESMARQLSLHPRTLRRRLEAEGTSYRDVLAAVRMDLAIGYLRKTRMTNEEIATRLGYSDSANFRHAFVRWTGKSPSSFRPR